MLPNVALGVDAVRNHAKSALERTGPKPWQRGGSLCNILQPAFAMVTPEIAGRLFVVGCPRSGTTLLQSLLAAHPSVHSFPETAVFGRLLKTNIMPDGTFPTVHLRTQLGYLQA